MKLLRATQPWLGLIGCVLSSASARAQTTGPDGALAEALYQQARHLMQQRQYSEACPKFAESQRLDPATGTLLNLAACHEAEQKLTSAWVEYAQAETQARRDQRDDRVRYAHEHGAALWARLARLQLLVDASADLPDLDIAIDGVTIRGPARQVPTPLDPGVHVVEARAPARQTWSQRVTIDQQPSLVTIRVPMLAPMIESESAGLAAPKPIGANTSPDAPSTTGIYLLGGTAGALTLGAGITAYGYMNARAQSGADYSDERRRTWGYANLAFVAGALLAVGTSTYWYFSQRRANKASTSGRDRNIALSPCVGIGSAGLQLSGDL